MKLLSWKIRLILLGAFAAPVITVEQAIAVGTNDPFLSTVQSINVPVLESSPAASAFINSHPVVKQQTGSAKSARPAKTTRVAKAKTSATKSDAAASSHSAEIQRLNEENLALERQIAFVEQQIAASSTKPKAIIPANPNVDISPVVKDTPTVKTPTLVSAQTTEQRSVKNNVPAALSTGSYLADDGTTIASASPSVNAHAIASSSIKENKGKTSYQEGMRASTQESRPMKEGASGAIRPADNNIKTSGATLVTAPVVEASGAKESVPSATDAAGKSNVKTGAPRKDTGPLSIGLENRILQARIDELELKSRDNASFALLNQLQRLQQENKNLVDKIRHISNKGASSQPDELASKQQPVQRTPQSENTFLRQRLSELEQLAGNGKLTESRRQELEKALQAAKAENAALTDKLAVMLPQIFADEVQAESKRTVPDGASRFSGNDNVLLADPGQGKRSSQARKTDRRSWSQE